MGYSFFNFCDIIYNYLKYYHSHINTISFCSFSLLIQWRNLNNPFCLLTSKKTHSPSSLRACVFNAKVMGKLPFSWPKSLSSGKSSSPPSTVNSAASKTIKFSLQAPSLIMESKLILDWRNLVILTDNSSNQNMPSLKFKN